MSARRTSRVRSTLQGSLSNLRLRSVVLLVLLAWLIVVTSGQVVASLVGQDTKGVCIFVRMYTYDPADLATFSAGVSGCPIELPALPSNED
jgi:hypothetical protein